MRLLLSWREQLLGMQSFANAGKEMLLNLGRSANPLSSFKHIGEVMMLPQFVLRGGH